MAAWAEWVVWAAWVASEQSCLEPCIGHLLAELLLGSGCPGVRRWLRTFRGTPVPKPPPKLAFGHGFGPLLLSSGISSKVALGQLLTSLCRCVLAVDGLSLPQLGCVAMRSLQACSACGETTVFACGACLDASSTVLFLVWPLSCGISIQTPVWTVHSFRHPPWHHDLSWNPAPQADFCKA